MWGERDHREEWVGEGSQVVSSRGHNKFTSRSHRPFRKVHACAWGDGETRTAITGEISLLDCVLCMGQSFPISGKRKASLGISVNQWACSSVSCEDSILMRGDLYSCDSFWKDLTFQVPDAGGVCVFVEYHHHLCTSPSGLHICVSFWRWMLCCHSAGSWGGCWFFSGYFWPGKSVHWNCAWASCEKAPSAPNCDGAHHHQRCSWFYFVSSRRY